MTKPPANNDELLVLAVAPTGRDAEMIAATLKERGFNCEPFADLLLACELLDRGVGVLLIAEEALSPASTDALGGFIRNQPSWSELPIIILAAGGVPSEYSAQMLSIRQPLGIVLVLERPIRQETLIAAVASSMQSRRRCSRESGNISFELSLQLCRKAKSN